MRHRLGLKLGLITLIASFISNLITCAAEIGGVALVLQLLTGCALCADGGARDRRFRSPSSGCCRSSGSSAPTACSACSCWCSAPRWSRSIRRGTQIAGGLVPQVPHGLSTSDLLAFAYFAVAIISAVMFPYETLFLFVRRDRGGMERQGSADQPADAHPRIRPRLAARDRDPRQLARSCSGRRNLARDARDGRAGGRRCRSATSALLLGAARHAVRHRRRGDRDLPRQCL